MQSSCFEISAGAVYTKTSTLHMPVSVVVISVVIMRSPDIDTSKVFYGRAQDMEYRALKISQGTLSLEDLLCLLNRTVLKLRVRIQNRTVEPCI
jgi:hypothetical protein